MTTTIVAVEPRFSSLLGPAVGALESRDSPLPRQSARLLFLPSTGTWKAFSTVHSHRSWHALFPKTFWAFGAPGFERLPPQCCYRPSQVDSSRWRGVGEVVVQGKGRHRRRGAPDSARAPDWGRPEGGLPKNGLVFPRSDALESVQAPGWLWRVCFCLGCEHMEGNVKTKKPYSHFYIWPARGSTPPLQWHNAPWWPGTRLLAAITNHLISCTPSRGSQAPVWPVLSIVLPRSPDATLCPSSA